MSLMNELVKTHSHFSCYMLRIIHSARKENALQFMQEQVSNCCGPKDLYPYQGEELPRNANFRTKEKYSVPLLY